MRTKLLILALMFVLLIPLNIAADNLAGNGKREIKSSEIIVTISTTSDWTRISFNGASIRDYKILDMADGLKAPIVDSNGIIINRYKNDGTLKTIRLELKLSIFNEKVELGITKDYNGETNVTVDKIGEFRNTKKPLHVPVTIETTSDWAKAGLSGATIRNVQVLEVKGTTLREPIIGMKSIILAKTEANDTSYGRARFLVNLSLDTPVPLITLEKANNGMAKASFGESFLENNRTAVKILKNIPLTIETTSNKTEIDFQGLYVRKAKPVDVATQNLNELMIGSDFILLNYSHSGNSYRKASYLIDFGVTGIPANITITKNDPGYSVVSFTAYNFANIGQDENKSTTYSIDPALLPSTKARETLFELDQAKENKPEVMIFPLHIETTSDWTEISLGNITIAGAEIKSSSGNIKRPEIGENTILIKKSKTYDSSFSAVDLLLRTTLNENFVDMRISTITLKISKGDIGSTTVRAGKTESFVNAEKIKNDPRNTKTYEIPLTAMQAEKKSEEEEISYNPVVYSVALFNDLYEKKIQLADTQEMWNTYSIDADTLPGRNKINFNLRTSEAVGLLSGVALSYLILIILGIYLLSKEGFFDFIPGLIGEDKTTVQSAGAFAIKLFEKTPASSLFILEALTVLAVTPFILLLNQTYAEGTAILAYFLLVSGVGLRLVGEVEKVDKIFIWLDSKIVVFIIKIESVVVLIVAAVIAGYELIGIYGSLVVFLSSLLLIASVYKYLRHSFEDSNFTKDW